MKPMLEIMGISKTFGKTNALSDINLVIEEGQFFALVGPSGSGKTTLLHILGGFIEQSAGQILIAGEDVSRLPPSKRPTTSVFQDYALFPHMSVGTNVGFGLLMRKVPKAERLARIEEALDMVGLSGMSSRRVHRLSGGQKQRVALARALVVKPKVVLLDEPLGALDLNLRHQMQQELVHIQKQLGTTFVHVTHDQEEAISIADVITVLNNGRVEDVGPPERVYMKPKTLFTATFMGENNILEGKVINKAAGRIEIETVVGCFSITADVKVGKMVNLSIRPEQIAVGEDNLAGRLALGKLKVQTASFFGSHHRCQGQHMESDLPMTIRLPQKQPVKAGEELTLSVARDDIVLLTH